MVQPCFDSLQIATYHKFTSIMFKQFIFFLQTCQKSKKITAAEYATAKCKELASILPVLDKEYSGLQAPHEDG